ncbi:hypothetical protein [Microbulbifer sp. VAAF005]|uniref:hypothetical protein n=1 Tax=Microbulbifer sp. VAAF005 TaxID=3034230 RepID=UPI0024AD2FF7|nr:hypothetical protein [Microbulbifer sp. VAAF005]WHI47478.1 hypothetical protein P0078_03580 [Microbulbifer sp. VAAF005]
MFIRTNRNSQPQKTLKSPFVLLLTAMLFGCGGGGGSSSDEATPQEGSGGGVVDTPSGGVPVTLYPLPMTSW